MRAPLLLLAALAAAPRLAAQAPVTIRLGTLAPQNTSYHRILLEMGQAWRTGTGGRVATTVYAGTLGSEAELVRRMRVGTLQAAVLTADGLREIEPAVGALQLMPMMFRTLEEAEYVRQQLQPALERRIAERGFVVLFWADAGWVRFFTRRSAVRPDEFRQLKVFVTAGQADQFDLMRAAGYQPVALEWTDALTGLQTGMIDAVPTIPYFALAMQFDTQARFMLQLNWVPVVGAAIVRKATWDALTPEQQAAMRTAAQTAGQAFQARGRQEGDESVAAMQRRGLTVVPVPAAAEAEWRTLAEGIYPRIRGSLVPAEMFDEVRRLLTAYRARPAGR